VGGQDFSIETSWGRTHDGKFGLTAWLDKHRSSKTLEMRTNTDDEDSTLVTSDGRIVDGQRWEPQV